MIQPWTCAGEVRKSGNSRYPTINRESSLLPGMSLIKTRVKKLLWTVLHLLHDWDAYRITRLPDIFQVYPFVITLSPRMGVEESGCNPWLQRNLYLIITVYITSITTTTITVSQLKLWLLLELTIQLQLLLLLIITATACFKILLL